MDEQKTILSIVEGIEKREREIAESLLLLKQIAVSLDSTQKVKGNPVYTIHIKDCFLSHRAIGVLVESKINYLGELCAIEPSVLCRYKNCGKKTIAELEALLVKHGLYWGDTTYLDSL